MRPRQFEFRWGLRLDSPIDMGYPAALRQRTEFGQ